MYFRLLIQWNRSSIKKWTWMTTCKTFPHLHDSENWYIVVCYSPRLYWKTSLPKRLVYKLVRSKNAISITKNSVLPEINSSWRTIQYVTWCIPYTLSKTVATAVHWLGGIAISYGLRDTTSTCPTAGLPSIKTKVILTKII